MCWYFSIQSNDSVERDDFDSSLWAIPHNILCPNSDLTLTNRSFIMIKFPPQLKSLFRLKSSTVTARIVLCEQTRGGVESNEFRIDFYRIFRIIFHLSNQSNHKFSNRIERISNESSIWKIWLHPIVGVESNRTNFELIFIEFFEYFLPFRINRIANFRIESNKFRTNSNLTPPLNSILQKFPNSLCYKFKISCLVKIRTIICFLWYLCLGCFIRMVNNMKTNSITRVWV